MAGNTFVCYKNQNYEDLITKYNSTQLFVDSEFPCNISSLGDTPEFLQSLGNVEWKRPYDICRNPQFIVDGAHRFDSDQGELGNCWFISAVSLITLNPNIFEHVCPQNQSFDKESYAGVFHFRFCYYGKWTDVVVDDYLPTKGNRLVFCRNTEQPNEFWIALIEKAYAKLYGSYQALAGGYITKALVDLTGGKEEYHKTSDIKGNDQFWDKMRTALMHRAMIGCSTSVEETRNGLIENHAYAITNVAVVKCTDDKSVFLVRCRNPWGNKDEWQGAWNDGDKSNWNRVDLNTKEKLKYQEHPDGEFWISYSDWLEHFECLQICYLPSNSFRRQTTTQPAPLLPKSETPINKHPVERNNAKMPVPRQNNNNTKRSIWLCCIGCCSSKKSRKYKQN